MKCKNCQKDFIITDADRQFYNKINIPEPTLCPDCRQQRRLIWRNERNFYQDKCDLCGKDMISVISPDKPYKVYCIQCFWTGNWDPLSYGRDYDFSRPFFEQFKELRDSMPVAGLFAEKNVNSDYVNFETDDKDCYLNIGGHYNEDCYYNTYAIRDRDCVDNYWLFSSELCYEIINGFRCYHCFWGLDLHDCRDCYFCYDCRGCENCFACSGLRQQKYMIFNQSATKEEFEKKVAELGLYKKFLDNKEKAYQVYLKVPKKYMTAVKCNDVSGDYLEACKRCSYVFDGTEDQDCKYLYVAANVRDSLDVNSIGFESELCYELIAAIYDYNVRFTAYALHSRDLDYCLHCSGASDCFGSIGIHHGKLCILNKQYEEEEYKKLRQKIIVQMRKNGEWGEFFPAELSPFGYNETVAQEYYPLTKEEALKQGFNWQDDIGGTFNKETVKPEELPDNIKEVSENITKEVFKCIDCDKNYKILDQELKFYQQQNIPLPRQCPYCRHIARINFRTTRNLWSRHCVKCGREVKTAYSPERPEIIYCQECYQKEIY